MDTEVDMAAGTVVSEVDTGLMTDTVVSEVDMAVSEVDTEVSEADTVVSEADTDVEDSLEAVWDTAAVDSVENTDADPVERQVISI